MKYAVLLKCPVCPAVFGMMLCLVSATVIHASPQEASYDVWGGNVLDLGKSYYGVDKLGWTKLGTADKTAYFSGRYNYYLIALKAPRILYVDAAQTSDGAYYDGAPYPAYDLVVGNVRGETTDNVYGPPDGKYLVMDASGSMSKSAAVESPTYASFIIFTNSGSWDGMKFFVYSRPAKPKAPSGLKLQVASSRSIRVSWSDNSKNETAFIIQRSLSKSGPWVQQAKVGPNVTSHLCQSLKPGTRYYFRVCAGNRGRLSEFSKTASATTRKADSPPMDAWLQEALDRAE